MTDERRHEDRREMCRHCPLTEGGYCQSHIAFTSFWKWGLSICAGAILSGLGMVWTEARNIHTTLAEIKVAWAGAAKQIEVNTIRLDRLEDDVFGNHRE